MALVIQNSGKREFVTDALGSNQVRVKLFSNDLHPGPLDKLTNYIETSGGGYLSKIVYGKSWDFSEALDLFIATSNKTVKWIFKEAVGEVYGYFVTSKDGETLLWSERFEDAPFVVKNKGDEIKLVLKLEFE